ncbi:MAG: class I SAM-dependent methyltransferase [Candidatus Rifleibacteriota bacterium]
MRKVFDFFISSQVRLSAIFDKFLPTIMRRDGYSDYISAIMPTKLKRGLKIVDVGGGKKPVISLAQKEGLGLKITGFDLSSRELKKAPQGIYDHIFTGDICKTCINLNADLVICIAVLEHVKDTEAALKNIAAMLNPEGKALIFVPCRNSIYAQLNLILPQNLKRTLLSFLCPGSEKYQGFKSFYDRCTPAKFKQNVRKACLKVIDEYYYFQSDYFSFFLPLHVLYRLTTLLLRRSLGNDAAETFTLLLQRSDD